MTSPGSSSGVDRARASLFGSAAERYDRFREPCPEPLVDDLVHLEARSVLDVGCGTGQVARPLLARGLTVLGVEIDERMADIARRHGVEVEVGPFETWDPRGRCFDLLTSGDAWGWLEPQAALDKAAEALRPGGTIACFWTTRVFSEDVSAALAAGYNEHAPEATQVWNPAVNIPRAHAARSSHFDQHGAFGPVDLQTHERQHVYRTEDWVGLVSTFSDHLRLGEHRLQSLLNAVRETITDLGGTVPADLESYALVAKRV